MKRTILALILLAACRREAPAADIQRPATSNQQRATAPPATITPPPMPYVEPTGTLAPTPNRRIQAFAEVPTKRRAVASAGGTVLVVEALKANLRIRWAEPVGATGSVASQQITLAVWDGGTKRESTRTYTGKLSDLTVTAVHKRGMCRAQVTIRAPHADGDVTFQFSSLTLVDGFIGTDAAPGIEQ